MKTFLDRNPTLVDDFTGFKILAPYLFSLDSWLNESSKNPHDLCDYL